MKRFAIALATAGLVVTPGVFSAGIQSVSLTLAPGQRLRILKGSFAQAFDGGAGSGSGKLVCDNLSVTLNDSNGAQVAVYASGSGGSSILGCSSGLNVFVETDQLVSTQDYNGLGGTLGVYTLSINADLRNTDVVNHAGVVGGVLLVEIDEQGER